MQQRTTNHGRRTAWCIPLAFALAASTASAQSGIILPVGSVIIVRTTTPLQSATAQVGQTFITNVDESVGVDDYTVIPAGSTIRATITVARPATRQQSGVIDVTFDRLTLPDGSSIVIAGKLTSTDSAERAQIKTNPNAHVVLVGARGGIGAGIAGAGSGSTANNILAALGGLLSEGRDVDVPAGTPLAVELVNSVSLRSRGRGGRGMESSTIYTSADRIREAQTLLARQNYYRGPVSGRLDDATRRALFQFQVDHRINGTGNLDGRTAQALGMNISATANAILSADDASLTRRDAEALVARYRTDLGGTGVRLDPMRAYSLGDLELWFALSAFSDNTALYEQVARVGVNRDAAVLAGKALISAARRVDAAMPAARSSVQVQTAWATIRQRLSVIENP